MNEAYKHYFFHYTATPLLVVETSQFDPEHDDEALDDLVKQVHEPHPRHALLRPAALRRRGRYETRSPTAGSARSAHVA